MAIHTQRLYYVFFDGIYLQWTIFIQTIHDPLEERNNNIFFKCNLKELERMWNVVLACVSRTF
jgi:hypothetical protein